MTGIERLREFVAGISPITVVCGVTKTSYDREHMEVVGARLRDLLSDIADQIERERACDGDTIENVRLIVGGVVDDMERHVSGAEGMEDSPVARWARELREALGGDVRDPSADVSVSAYDLLPADEREAIAWVREHGGLSHVKDIYHDFRAVVERLGVEWSESELHGLMDVLDRRLMPDGMSWPVFEDGEPVRIGDVVSDVEVRSVVFRDGGILLSDCTSVPGWGTWRSYKEPIKRPAPKVLDADGVEIREKRDVWWICEGDERGLHAGRLRVETILPDGLVECSPYNGGTWVILEPSELYVNKPVPASDGRPLREGEHVWHVETGREYVVVEPSYGKTVVVRLAKYDDAEGEQYAPDQLTHRAPVLAADGRPLREGETVRHKQTGRSATVKGFDRMLGEPCAVIDFAGIEQRVRGALLTHERPAVAAADGDGCCELGTYRCQELAFTCDSCGHTVFVDKCMVDEIRYLRANGIRTLNCCCGHGGKAEPFIIVNEGDECRMLNMGYERRVNEHGVTHFTPKSACPPKALAADGEPLREGDTVWDVDDGCELVVTKIADDAVFVAFEDVEADKYDPSQLTHERPETRQSIADEIGEDMVKRIDAIVSAGRWS